jgi:hypothetical protein
MEQCTTMAKAAAPKAPLAVTVVMNTKNEKLIGKSELYNWVTTYTEVGPTCPTSCWFHPESEFTEQRKALGLKACYTKRGRVSFSVSAKRFDGADYGPDAMVPVKERFDRMFFLHESRREVVDGIRFQTGGDILHPFTGRPWVEFIELIKYVIDRALVLGIPVIGFTATWREPEVQVLRGLFHASVQTFEDAQQALAMGWTVAWAVGVDETQQAVSQLRTAGARAVFCPEQAGKAKSCSDCGICAVADASRLDEVPGEDNYMLYRKRFVLPTIPLSIVLKNH